MATGNAGELLKLSGIRNPYPGDLGVVKEGAMADLLMVDGNPLEEVKVVGELKNLRVIIKADLNFSSPQKPSNHLI